MLLVRDCDYELLVFSAFRGWAVASVSFRSWMVAWLILGESLGVLRSWLFSANLAIFSSLSVAVIGSFLVARLFISHPFWCSPSRVIVALWYA